MKGKINDRGIASVSYNVLLREGFTLGLGASFDTQKLNEASHKVKSCDTPFIIDSLTVSRSVRPSSSKHKICAKYLRIAPPSSVIDVICSIDSEICDCDCHHFLQTIYMCAYCMLVTV